MSKKKVKKGQPQDKKVQAPTSEKVIQYIAIAVIALVVVFIAFPYIKQLATKPVATEAPVSQAEAPAAADGAAPASVCAEFDSIPTAEQYAEPPMKIDETKQYFANVKMAKGGEFVIQLYPNKAPITVNSFVFLTCKGFYNGLTFHRVMDDFMAQGGDPTGTGTGGPGYSFVDEPNDLVFDKAGILAMANSGPDTNGSQFFITYAPTDWLNGMHTIFGEVIEGMDVVNGITRGDPNTPGFTGDVMESVTITEK